MNAVLVHKILVVLLGGTMLSKGVHLTPISSAKELLELFKDFWTPENIEFSFVKLRKTWDSGNVSFIDLIIAARKIKCAYKDIDGVIVISGTGKAARITAGLSFIFRKSLQKPILVTGSLKASEEPGSDAPAQWVSVCRAMMGFLREGIVGVHWVWKSQVLLGTRLIKVSDTDEPAFVTPGRMPIATITDSGVIPDPLAPRKADNWQEIELELHDRFSRKMHSSIEVCVDDDPWLLKTMANHFQRCQAVILNVPDPPDRKWSHRYSVSWIDAIEYAVNKGMFIGITFPWQPCRVNLAKYKLGYKAERAGAVGLGSLTLPAAEMKLRQAIALFRSDREKIREFLLTDLVGELLPGDERKGN